MWDELPPLIAIKTDKEESKLTFNACEIGLFDNESVANEKIQEEEPRSTQPVTSSLPVTHDAKVSENKQASKASYNFYDSTNGMPNLKRHFCFDDKQTNRNDYMEYNTSTTTTKEMCAPKPIDANLQSIFSPSTWHIRKMFNSSSQPSNNRSNENCGNNNYDNVEAIMHSTTESWLPTKNEKEIDSSGNNKILTALIPKWHLSKAKELLQFAHAPWHKSTSTSTSTCTSSKTENEEMKALDREHTTKRRYTSSTRPHIEEVIDILHAYLSRVKAYTLYKNKCTDAYLTNIERDVDRYLLMFFSRQQTRTPVPLVSPVKFVEHLQTSWWNANNSIKTFTNTMDKNNPKNDNEEYLCNCTANTGSNSSLLENRETENEWSSTAREVAKAGLSKASATFRDVSSAWLKTEANACNSTDSANINVSTNKNISYNDCNKATTVKGNAENLSDTTLIDNKRIYQSNVIYYYTCDVIPEHYADEAPCTEALERIRMNYPILLYVLNHTLQHKSQLSDHATHDYQSQEQNTYRNNKFPEVNWADNVNRVNVSTVKPIQRKWMQSDVAKALVAEDRAHDEYTRLRTKLFLPTIKNVWEVYLLPLHAKAVELIHVAEENVLLAVREGKVVLQEKETQEPNFCTDESSSSTKRIAPFLYQRNSSTSFAKQSRELTELMAEVDTAVRNLHSDVEYIQKIRRMDDAFVACTNANIVDDKSSDSSNNTCYSSITKNRNKMQNDADELERTCETIHTISDQIPVYGLILSRLHRLEMEHRTVLELWDHAPLYTGTQPL